MCSPEPPAIQTLTSPRGATSLTTSLLLLAAFSADTAAAVLPVLEAVLSAAAVAAVALTVAAVVLGLSEMRTGTPSEFLMRSLRCELRCDLHLLLCIYIMLHQLQCRGDSARRQRHQCLRRARGAALSATRSCSDSNVYTDIASKDSAD
jgi:hypothetical protein